MTVRIEVREFTITSGTGNIDFTGFSFQPKACLFVMTGNDTDNTDSSDSHRMLGMCDGTREWAIQSVSENGAGTSNVGRRSTTTGCILHIDHSGAQAVVGKASFVSFLSDGVRVNRTTTFSSPTAPILRIIAFGGDDVSAYGDIFDPSDTEGASVVTTAVGFEPDVIITGMIGNHEDSDGATQNDDDSFSIGWAVNPARQASNNQYCIGMASEDANTNSESRMGIFDNRCSVSRQDDATDTGIEITAFSSTGFTATTRDAVAGTNDRFFYLALNVGGSLSRIFSVNQNQPATTGSQSQTGAGFRPQFLFGIAIGDGRAFNAWGTEGDADNASIGLGMVDMARNFSVTVWDEDEAGTTITGTRVRNTHIWSLADESGTPTQSEATFTSFDQSGWTLNFTTASGLRGTSYLAFGGIIRTETFTCDALLEKTFDKTFTCDAILVNRFTHTFLCDAYLEQTQDFIFTCDGLMETSPSHMYLIDALLEMTFDQNFDVDARLSKVVEYEVDAYLVRNTYFTIDSLLEQTFDETFTIDAYLVRDANFSLDAILRGVTILVDSKVIVRKTKTFIVDTILSQEILKPFTVDSLLSTTNTFTFDIDAVTYLPIYNTFTIDLLLEKERTKTFTIDCILEQEKTKTFEIDSILISSTQPTKLFLVDARLEQLQTKTFTIQANLRFVNNKPFTIDGLILITGDVLCSGNAVVFSEDFSAPTGWIETDFSNQLRLNVSPYIGSMGFVCLQSENSGTRKLTKSFNQVIPINHDFTWEFKHNHIGGCNSFATAYIAQLQENTSNNGVSTNQFTIRYVVSTFLGSGANEGLKLFVCDKNGANGVFSTGTLELFDTTIYYPRITRVGNTVTLYLFTDSARTSQAIGSPLSLDITGMATDPLNAVYFGNYGSGGGGRQATEEFDDIVVKKNLCPYVFIDSILTASLDKTFTVDAKLVYRQQFSCDVILKKTFSKTIKIDAFFDVATQGEFDVDAYLVRVNRFSLDALIKALGDNRCPFENIFEEHFTTTSGWSVEVNNTSVDGWGVQRIFIDGESGVSQELDSFGNINGFAYIVMPPGGYSGAMQPILKSKYRRKKLDSNGGIGRVRGNNIRVDLELTHISGARGKWVVLNKSSLHPDNDPNTSTLNLNVASAGSISATLDDGINSATTSSISIGSTKRYIVIESVGNTLTLNTYTDEAHTTHVVGSPVSVNTSSVNKDQLDLSWLIIGANDKNAGTANPDTVGKVDNVKIFSSPCPVAYVDGYLTASDQTQFTIDAKLIREFRFTIDAIIQGRKFFNVDARLVREREIVVDAYLSKAMSSLFTVDPLLIGAVDKTFTIDGIPFVPPAVLFNADAIVNLQDVNKTFDVDSILLEGTFHTFTVDAFLIQFTINKNFTVDSRIRTTNVESFYADALVKALGDNGVCNFYPDTNFAIDTGLEQYIGPITPEHEESVDLLIGQEVVLNNQQVRRVTFLLRASDFPNEITDTSLITGKIWSNVVIGNPAGEVTEATSQNTIDANSISGDLPIGVWTQITFTYDQLTTPFLTGNYVIGFQHFVGINTNDPKGVGVAIPVISNSNVIGGSAVMRRESNSIIDPLTWQYLTTISKDMIIRVEVVNGDDIVEGINKQCPRIDSLLSSPNTEVISVDAHIANRKLFTLDALFDQTKSETFIVDARLIGQPKIKVDAVLITASVFRIDAITFTPPAITFSIDALLRGAKFSIDANIQQQNINKVFNCNAMLSVPDNVITFSIDAKTQYFNLMAPFTVDAIVIVPPSTLIFVDGIVKKFGFTKLFRVESLLEKTQEFDFTIDARTEKENNKIFTVDAGLILKDELLTFEITASLAITQPPILFTVDALISRDNIRWRSDALLRLRKTKVLTTDAILASRLSETYLADALIKDLNVVKTITIDSIIKKQTDLQFIVDTNLQSEGGVLIFAVNARVVFPFKKPKVDAKVVNRRIKTFTIDAFIDPPFTSKAKVDALVKCLSCSGNLFCTNTFTIDAYVGINEKIFTLDAKLNKIKSFSIDAMVGEIIDIGVEAESVISQGSGDIGFESTFGIGGTQ